MEPCQGPIKRIYASYRLKIYCLWRGYEVKSDIQQTVSPSLTAIKYMIQNRKSGSAPSLSCHHMRVIERERADDLRSGQGGDSFDLIICEDRLRDSSKLNEYIRVQVNSDVFANPQSRESFFDGVNLLLNFLTDDASI